MNMSEKISAEFPFESRYMEVEGSKMHYIDEGKGDPILFLHGNPTSSYLWRNIIPYLVPHARCIALDLIGMGKSDKPDIDYRFTEHYTFVEKFISKLNLNNLTLVVHDWGSGIGFHYAFSNPEKIKALAFMESLVKPFTWSGLQSEFKLMFKMMRTPVLGWIMINVFNFFIKVMMPKTILRKLSIEEKNAYMQPFKSIKSRKPIRRWPCEVPIDGEPADVHDIISNYSERLKHSEIPKLLLYAEPGAIIDEVSLKWCVDNIENLEIEKVGEGIHYIQEDVPHTIGDKLRNWYVQL
ncbi:haloalkane dehalogenase [bacterium I07]|nr:haloalkane dehalogenase [bacterium I07]